MSIWLDETHQWSKDDLDRAAHVAETVLGRPRMEFVTYEPPDDIPWLGEAMEIVEKTRRG